MFQVDVIPTHVLDFGTSEACKGIGAIRSRHKSSLSKVVLGLEIPDLSIVGSVDNADRDGEDGVALELG